MHTARSPRFATLALALVVLAFVAATARAQGYTYGSRDILNFQGQLADASGQPVTGTYEIIINVYDVASGGSPLHSEAFPAVAVSRGVYNVALGSTTPIPLAVKNPDDGVVLWMEIQVTMAPGQTETLLPRQRLASSLFATNADLVDGFEASAFALQGDVIREADGIAFTPVAPLTATNVQSAVAEVNERVTLLQTDPDICHRDGTGCPNISATHTCPTDMNDMGYYCIDKAFRGQSKSYNESLTICYGANMRFCTPEEAWYAKRQGKWPTGGAQFMFVEGAHAQDDSNYSYREMLIYNPTWTFHTNTGFGPDSVDGNRNIACCRDKY